MNDDIDILKRGARAADNFRNATHQLSASWISHKIAMYRDLSLVSAVILTGLVVFVGPDDVTWPFPYYAAIAAFVTVLVLSASVMRACVRAERHRLAACEAALSRLSSAIRSMEVNPTPETASLLASALGTGIEAEPTPSRMRRLMENTAFWLFIAAILGAFSGLMLDPTRFHQERDPGPDVITTSFTRTRA